MINDYTSNKEINNKELFMGIFLKHFYVHESNQKYKFTNESITFDCCQPTQNETLSKFDAKLFDKYYKKKTKWLKKKLVLQNIIIDTELTNDDLLYHDTRYVFNIENTHLFKSNEELISKNNLFSRITDVTVNKLNKIKYGLEAYSYQILTPNATIYLNNILNLCKHNYFFNNSQIKYSHLECYHNSKTHNNNLFNISKNKTSTITKLFMSTSTSNNASHYFIKDNCTGINEIKSNMDIYSLQNGDIENCFKIDGYFNKIFKKIDEFMLENNNAKKNNNNNKLIKQLLKYHKNNTLSYTLQFNNEALHNNQTMIKTHNDLTKTSMMRIRSLCLSGLGVLCIDHESIIWFKKTKNYSQYNTDTTKQFKKMLKIVKYHCIIKVPGKIYELIGIVSSFEHKIINLRYLLNKCHEKYQIMFYEQIPWLKKYKSIIAQSYTNTCLFRTFNNGELLNIMEKNQLIDGDNDKITLDESEYFE